MSVIRLLIYDYKLWLVCYFDLSLFVSIVSYVNGHILLVDNVSNTLKDITLNISVIMT